MQTDAQPPRIAVSSEAYANAVDRLRVNFRVAIFTNLIAVVILLGSAAGAVALVLADEFGAAGVPVLLSILDITWAVTERPWRQLWLANNRIALSDSLWVAYLETKEAIENSGMESERQLAQLLEAQNRWVWLNGAIARDNYESAFASLEAISQRPNPLQSQLERVTTGATTYESPPARRLDDS